MKLIPNKLKSRDLFSHKLSTNTSNDVRIPKLKIKNHKNIQSTSPNIKNHKNLRKKPIEGLLDVMGVETQRVNRNVIQTSKSDRSFQSPSKQQPIIIDQHCDQHRCHTPNFQTEMQLIEKIQSRIIPLDKQCQIKTQESINSYHQQSWQNFQNNQQKSLIKSFIVEDNPNQTKSNLFFVFEKLEKQLSTNRSLILEQYKNKINQLQHNINHLQSQLKQKQLFMMKLSKCTTQSNSYQQQIKKLQENIIALEKRIKSLEDERKYLYQNLQRLVAKIKLVEERQISYRKIKDQQKQKLQLQFLEIVTQKNNTISQLIKNIQTERITKRQTQLRNQLIEHQLNQLIIQNKRLKKQSQFKNVLQSCITSRSQYKQSSIISIPDKSFEECSIIEKIQVIKSQLPIQQQQSLLDLSRNSMMNQPKTDQPLEIFVKNVKNNHQAQKVLVLKLVDLYQNNLQQKKNHYYDPNSLTVKGKSKFLQLQQIKHLSFSIFYTDSRFLAPQLINAQKNYKVNEEAALVWNLGLMIDYILNQQPYFKQICGLKNNDNKELGDLIKTMVSIKPQLRPKIKQVSQILHSN